MRTACSRSERGVHDANSPGAEALEISSGADDPSVHSRAQEEGRMPRERISMRKFRDTLRLRFDAKLSYRQIAACLKLSVGVISKYLALAAAAGLSWPLPDSMD